MADRRNKGRIKTHTPLPKLSLLYHFLSTPLYDIVTYYHVYYHVSNNAVIERRVEGGFIVAHPFDFPSNKNRARPYLLE